MTDHALESRRHAIMKIGRACRESAQSRSFEASKITPEPGDVAASGVSQLSSLTCRFVAKSVKRKIRGAHFGRCGFNVAQEVISVRPIVSRVVTTTTPGSTRISDKEVSEKAAQYGVEAAPLSAYSFAPLLKGGLVLGYTTVNGRQIKEGMRRLAQALT